MAYHKLSPSDYIIINDLLRTVISKNADGSASYQLPWSDQAVVEALRPQITYLNKDHVRNMRQKIYGLTHPEKRRRIPAIARQAAAAAAVVGTTSERNGLLEQADRIERKLDALLKAWGVGEDGDGTIRH